MFHPVLQGFSVARRVRVLESSLFGGSGIVAAIGQTRVVLRCTRILYSVDAFALSLTLSEARIAFRCAWCTTVIDNRPAIVNGTTVIWASVVDGTLLGYTRVLTRVALVRNRSAVSDWAPIGYRASVIDGTLLGCTRIVPRLTFVSNWLTVCNGTSVIGRALVSDARVVACLTFVCCRATVIVTIMFGPVITGNGSSTCSCGSSRTGTCGCTGCGLAVAVGVHVGIELIGLLELTFLLEMLLLGKTIALSGVGVQLLGLSLLALGLCGLNFSVGVGLLGLSLAVFGVRFPSMNFVLGLGGLLTDPGGLLALVFALLSCGLTTDRNDDADDNQNNDDRYDYPDDGSCTHALSPCCLFGSH